jgi:hypothetical protein
MKGVVGIDFGTTHTHVSVGSTDSDKVETVTLETNHKGTISALLFIKGKMARKDMLWGNMAIEQYLNHDDDDDDEYDLRVNFKPDIENNESAARYARLFLENATEKVISQKKEKKILVGVPAGCTEGYKNKLKKLMKDSFGDVEPVSEPLGALVHFQERKQLNDDDILDDILVIDFGGGTCDFAYTYGGKLINVDLSDGFYYGGRLFDDLFFQWWEDANPEAAAECPENDKSFIFAKQCREVKEHFSTQMKQNRGGKFTNKIGFLGYGFLRGITWDDFLKRAEAYRPSKRFLKISSLPRDALEKFSKPRDLLELFRHLLQAVRKDHQEKYGTAQFKWVVLAGGSSLWPFVRDNVKTVLSIDEEHILQEPDPYSTIALGLAQIPYRRERLSEKKRKLTEDTLPKSREIVENAFAEFKKNLLSDIVSDSLSNSIWSSCFKPAYLAGIKREIDDNTLKKRLSEQRDKAQICLKRYWEKGLDDLFDDIKTKIERAVREDAQKNKLLFSLQRIKLWEVPLESFFDSFQFKEKERMSYIGAAFDFALNLAVRLYDVLLGNQKKRAAEQLEKLHQKFTEEQSKKVDELFRKKSPEKAEVCLKVERAIKVVIDKIELLQSQV